MASEAALAAALLESDRLYFELGARVEPVDGGVLAWIPGMERVPSACVVQRVGGRPDGDDPRRWVAGVTGRLAVLGCSVARIYLDASVPDLERALAEAGFRRRVEIGYLWTGANGRKDDDVVLRPVTSEAEWSAKHDLHAGADGAADGHVLCGRSWVDLERARCRDGRMQAYLVEADGEVCGAIAGLRVDGLLRAKNVFVRPDRRRRGIGAAAMQAMSRLAGTQGCAHTGIFGVEGKPGNALYRSLGMSPVVERFEWSRPLGPTSGAG